MPEQGRNLLILMAVIYPSNGILFLSVIPLIVYAVFNERDKSGIIFKKEPFLIILCQGYLWVCPECSSSSLYERLQIQIVIIQDFLHDNFTSACDTVVPSQLLQLVIMVQK